MREAKGAAVDARTAETVERLENQEWQEVGSPGRRAVGSQAEGSQQWGGGRRNLKWGIVCKMNMLVGGRRGRRGSENGGRGAAAGQQQGGSVAVGVEGVITAALRWWMEMVYESQDRE